MLAPPVPADEAERLAALHRYDVLDTESEPSFDDLTKLAAQLCGTPMALVTLIDTSRQWFKARHGIEASETPRELAFCAHTIAQGRDLMIVPDTHADERFHDNPYVTGDPNVRFYAGMPLVTPEGYGLGSLCVLDSVPRSLCEEQLAALRTLGRQVLNQLELRRSVAALKQAAEQQHKAEHERIHAIKRLESTLDAVADAILVVDSSGQIVAINQPFARLWGIPESILATGDDRAALSFVLDQLADPQAFIAKVEALYSHPEMSSLDELVFKDSRIIERYSHPYRVDGVTLGRVWGFRDVTERRRAEEERERLREEIIQTQARTLAELSSPLIPINEHVMVMPLIGTISGERAQVVLETLLAGVAANQVRVAILDITGVPVVDTAIANALVRAAQAVQLLGARVVLTGIRPEVAQTLVGLGIDLRTITTRSTLQSGIAFAIQQAG